MILLTDLSPESSPQLELFAARCLRSRLNTNQCQRCLDSCTRGALSVHNRKIAFDAAHCTGCMSCVTACPQDALVSDHDWDEMFNSFQSGADVVVSCNHQVQNNPDEVTIPCVGILSREVVVAMLLCGCNSVTFTVIGCALCRNRDTSNAFMAECQQIIEEFSDMNLSKVVWVERSDQLIKPKIDRRSYLTKIFDVAVDVSRKRIVPKRMTRTTEPEKNRRIPFKTKLLKKVFSNLDRDCRTKLLDLLCHNVSISQDCNCCPLCKGICPTGAIHIDRSDQRKTFRFERLDCSGCGLCVEFCKKNALSFEM